MNAIPAFPPTMIYTMTFSLLLLGAVAMVHAEVTPHSKNSASHAGNLNVVLGIPATKHANTQIEQAHFTEDTVLTEKVKNELQKNVVMKGTEIHVEALGGIVLLSGIIDNSNKPLAVAQIATAGQIAANVAGVNKVINNLILKA